jgi:phosphoribosylamine--glycine ligase
MNILVIGGGGREHVIIKKLKENPAVTNIYAMPGNGGIAHDAVCLPGAPTDAEAAVRYAKEKAVDFAVVSPDDPLVRGVADKLRDADIPAFGPTAKAAIIEGSKVFSKNLMRTYDIPTADYEKFDNAAEAVNYIETRAKYPVVIKADGLALGKGVVIAQNLPEAKDAIRQIMEDKIFGAAGNTVVIEEFLIGPEVTVLTFTDSKTIVPLVSSMDHKKAFDGDQGPNTGGMGVIAPNPHYTPEIAAECMERIFRPTVAAMNSEGRPFKGCLYFGLMLTADGPKVIEYNCRFGDPEAQAVLPLLESDLLTIMQAVEAERLHTVDVRFRALASCCVMLVSGGYPASYKTGFPIEGLSQVPEDVSVFHSGTALKDGALVTSGGRVLGITAQADALPPAIDRAYDAAAKVRFEGMYYRRDIGKNKLF